jgi:hypothetical protein
MHLDISESPSGRYGVTLNIRELLLIVLTSMCVMTACNRVAQDAQANQPAAPSGAMATTPASAANPHLAQPEPVVLPTGTSLAVRLQTTVSSAQSHTGDRFEAVLDEPLVVSGQTVARAGTPLTGRVLNAESSGRLEHPGKISVALVSMNVNGSQVPISTSRIYAQGKGHKRRNTEWIGGGAAGGALFGGLLGGGKGALIASAAGAGAGTATAAATGKQDIALDSQHRLTFRLTQAATMPAGS